MAIGKGSLQRAASAAAKVGESSAAAKKTAQTEREGTAKAAQTEQEGTVKAAQTEQEGAAKVTQAKKAGAPKRSTLPKQEPQGMWLATVKADQLCEIPDEWRGPKYVRPNVSMLAESVSRCGILEPLPVVQTGKATYQLVGGSRRMEVVKMLGIEEVPVVVLPGSSMEDAKRFYNEMKPYTDAAQDTLHNAKFRTAALFGAQRIPEYLL